jgi:hypothetical protein
MTKTWSNVGLNIIYKDRYIAIYMCVCTGWWFQTCFIFQNIWDVILPIDEFIFFKMVKTNHQPDSNLPIWIVMDSLW